MPLLRCALAAISLLLLSLVHASARAQCGGTACLRAGTTLATVTASQSSMLDGLVTSLTGASVDLTVGNHQTLAGANVRLDTLLGALQVQGACHPAVQRVVVSADCLMDRSKTKAGAGCWQRWA